jgi:hypothetical protein
MRQASIAVLVGGLLSCAATQMMAQAPPLEPPAAAPVRKLNLTVEQRYTIREIIKDVKDKPTSSSAAPAVGDPSPQGIEARPIPGEVAAKVPQVKSHKFFVAKDQIVIVDPKDNTVAELISLSP